MELAGAERNGEEKLAVALRSLGRLILTVDAVAHIQPPIHGGNEFGHLVGRIAQRIQTADDRAHAGAGDIIDGDAYLLHVLEHTDMRRTLGTAATEGDTHLGPLQA